MMKAINVFLLLLILTGLGAFITQKIWVPKLVNRIVSSEAVPPALVEASQPSLLLKDGRQCYIYSHEATSESPYKVSELMDVTIAEATVSGTKFGTQSGPNMTNSYNGTWLGAVDKITINGVFSYTIDGSKNKEAEIYRLSKKGIEKLRYPLVEKNGVLTPDITKDFNVMLYSRVDCQM